MAQSIVLSQLYGLINEIFFFPDSNILEDFIFHFFWW